MEQQNDGMPSVPLDHPWVIPAVMGLEPEPAPTQIKLDAVDLEIEEGKWQHAALLTVATHTGLTTVFITEAILKAFLKQGLEIVGGWEKERSNGFQIATPEMMRAAQAAADEQNRLHRG